MEVSSISIWGDSIGKGVVFDEARGRYAILPDNCVSQLKRALRCPVENHAFMGCTALKGEARMTDDEMRAGGVAAIEFGGNDCDMPWAAISENPDGEHQPNVTIVEFKRTMGRMVRRVRDAGMVPVMVTPPPLDAERYFRWVSRNLNAAAILRYLGDVQFIYRWQERYAAAVRDIAAATGCRLLDLRDAFLSQHRVADLLCIDGIHPNAAGHRLIADAILAAV
ncbi:MAG: SGNH/GDSL hydrolase family protein [Clostridiales bacterium]|nr:SGNH/GDSL hydrolase family protein [Clostridiales bacterium]